MLADILDQVLFDRQDHSRARISYAYTARYYCRCHLLYIGGRDAVPADRVFLPLVFRFWESSLFIDSLVLSLKLATIATILSLLIGFAAAFAIERHRFSGRELIQGFMLSPLLIPAVVLGLGLMQLQVWIGLSQSFLGLVIGHVVVTLTYVVRTLSASMVLFDQNLEQAAMSLRARPATVLRTITIPLLAPGIISSGVFAFVTSFGNVNLCRRQCHPSRSGVGLR